jgi:hypothetical protein
MKWTSLSRQMTERMKLSFIADFFNAFNSCPIRLMDQNFETQGGVLNFA